MSIFQPEHIKRCSRCGGQLALKPQDRKVSEGAYATEIMHSLVCLQCGFVRTERFVDVETYPLVLSDSQGVVKILDRSEQETLSKTLDPTNIGRAE